MINKIQHKGFQELVSFLKGHTPAALAFSGGTDSAFLAYVASRVIPPGQFMTYTFDTAYMNRSELEEARQFCEQYEIPHKVLPMPIPRGILDNPGNRCYLCKLTLFTTFRKTAEQDGMKYFFDGTNKDDTQGYRPGRKALKELGILSPILESGLGKEEVRTLSRELGLPTWNKPSNACLLTRLPYDHKVTEDLLRRIEAAETFLHAQGFTGVRVRTHGDLARLELSSEEMERLHNKELREEIVRNLKGLGYLFVTLDLEGFRSGSYDQALQEKK